jgi:hypothetical protein
MSTGEPATHDAEASEPVDFSTHFEAMTREEHPVRSYDEYGFEHDPVFFEYWKTSYAKKSAERLERWKDLLAYECVRNAFGAYSSQF